MKALLELRQRSKGYEPVNTDDDFELVPSNNSLNNSMSNLSHINHSNNSNNIRNKESYNNYNNFNNNNDNYNDNNDDNNEDDLLIKEYKEYNKYNNNNNKKESKFCMYFIIIIIITIYILIFLFIYLFIYFLDAWCLLLLSITGVIFLTSIAVMLKSNSIYIKLSKANSNNKVALGDSVVGAAMMYLITAILAAIYIAKSPKRYVNHFINKD